ncbi:STAS domain-containing protein [Actinoplanes bogorensis]|uniref:STAS domain-containing protein n=1 Tax=Paractinoplanes bogorensis TaxID=1610840 RepID=A0ABS5YMX8_9ACTN|nr:STAS domain-containing protein [Actinoplanes bogorensis]MBU2664401.1 STAS domain-containing protein [Actinoplanes bogorensis]
MVIAFATTADGRDLVATVSGVLARPDVAGLHRDLLKALAEQPAALFVDVSDLTVADPVALNVFRAVAQQAARWPGTPLLICAPPPAVRLILDGPAFRLLRVHAGLDAARAGLAAGRTAEVRSISDDLLPVSGAARHARDLATDACGRWDLPHLAGPAALILTEMVGNVIDHAGTMMTVHLTLVPRYLLLAVRDGSPVEVRRPVGGGRGLLLIEATAHAWGCVPSAGGKVVWASLRVSSPGAARGR